jgi:hypothetical protein
VGRRRLVRANWQTQESVPTGQIALPAQAFWSNIDLNRQATWGKSTPLAALHLRVVQGNNMRNLTHLIWFNRSSFLSYVIAALGVAVALIAALLLETYLQSSPIVLLFLCAIMFAAWFGGSGAGLTATVLSILAFDYFFLRLTCH